MVETTAQKILIVEDDGHLARALAIRLQGLGFEVVAARDAYHAIKVARHERLGLVIMDLQMPAGDGLRVHRSLNEFSDFFAPVIYITGHASDESEAQARALGAAAYLRKPVDFDQLTAVIRQHLAVDSAIGPEA